MIFVWGGFVAEANLVIKSLIFFILDEILIINMEIVLLELAEKFIIKKKIVEDQIYFPLFVKNLQCSI